MVLMNLHGLGITMTPNVCMSPPGLQRYCLAKAAGFGPAALLTSAVQSAKITMARLAELWLLQWALTFVGI